MSRKRRAAQRRPGGRPSKLDAPRVEQLTLVLRSGNYMETAAAFAGLDKTTVYDWLRKGREARAKGRHRSRFARFSHAVEKAMADGEVGLLGQVVLAGRGRPARYDAKGNLLEGERAPVWQANAWTLERRHPDRWGQRARVEVGLPGAADGTPVRIVMDLATHRAAGDEDAEG